MANLATINNNLLADSGIDPVDLIVGTGAVNYVPKFTAEGTIGNSIIQDNGTSITVAGGITAVGIISTSGTGLLASLRIANTTASTGRDWHLYSLNNGNFGLYNNTDGSYAYQVTPSGNFGLGVIPAAWRNIFNAFQIGYTGVLYALTTSNATEQVNLASNYYQNSAGNELRVQAGYSTRYQQASGQHIWSIAGSAAAGTGISYSPVMMLTSGGALLINTTSTTNTASGKIVNLVGGSSTPDLALNGGAWSIASIGGEPAVYLSSNIAAATGIPGASQTAKGGIGFEYVSAAAPTDLVVGIFGAPTVASSVRIFNNTERIRIASTGAIRFNAYGSGTFTGTRAYDLAVDASGNVIEVAVGAGTITGGGTAGQIAIFNGSSSITSESSFTYNSSTNVFSVNGWVDSYRRFRLYFNDIQTLAAELYEDGASTNGGTLNLFGKASGTVDTVISAAPTKLNYINNAANVMIGWNTDQFYKLAVNGDFYAALDARVGGKLGVGAAPISGVSLYIKGNSVDSPLLIMQGNANRVALIGDTTTGTTDVGKLLLYNAGVDTIMLSALANEESFINNSGGTFTVGATSSGGYKLAAFKADEDILRIHNTTTTGDALIAFTNADAGFLARIQGIDGGGLQFDTGNGAGGLNTNALFIRNDGNIGINTNSPASLLTIFGGGNTLRLDSSTGADKEILMRSVGTGTGTLKTDGNLRLWSEDSGRSIIFKTFGGESTIASSGVATFSSHVNSGGWFAAPNEYGLTATNAAGTAGRVLIKLNSSNQIEIGRDSDISRIIMGTAATLSAFTMLSNGNVGIGTTDPTGKLMVEATGNQLFLRASSATAGKYWNFDVTSANQLYIINNAGSQYLTILDGGNTGLGVVSPSHKLDVSGRIRAFTASSGVSPRTDLGGTIIAEGSTRAGLYILTSGTAAGSYGSIWWGNGNTNTDAYISVANDTRAMDFGTADGFRMRITASGPVVIGGTTPVNVSSGRGNLTINGTSTAIMNLTVNDAIRGYMYHNGTSMDIVNSGAGVIEMFTNSGLVATLNSGTSGQRNFVVGSTTALATSSNRANITINGNSNSILAFAVSNVLKSYLYNNGTDLFMNSGAGSLTFENDNATAMVISSGGGVGIRTTPGTFQLAVNGSNNGIDFETNNTSTFATSIFYTIRETGVSRTITTGGYSYGPSNPLTMILTQNSDTPLGMYLASDNSGGAGLKGYKSRGTVAAPVSVNNGDTIFSMEGWAFHGSGPNHAKFGAGMRFVKDDAFGTANTFAPQRTEFYNAVNTTTVQTNMIIYPNGNTAIGTGTYYGSYKLYVQGIVASNTGFLIDSGQYNTVSEVPYTGMYMTGSSSSDGFGALLISSRTDTSRPIVFGTYNGTALGERARITGVGEFWLGYTSDQGAYLLQVNGSTYSASGFFESSDIRLKTILNRHHSVDFDAIEYNWNDERDSKLHWGYAAQEVMKFLPDAVSGSEELFYTLDYNQVHTYKIAMLEKRIAELEQQLKNK